MPRLVLKSTVPLCVCVPENQEESKSPSFYNGFGVKNKAPRWLEGPTLYYGPNDLIHLLVSRLITYQPMYLDLFLKPWISVFDVGCVTESYKTINL